MFKKNKISKNNTKKELILHYWKHGLLAILIVVVIIIGSIYRHELSVVAASYTWTQTDWSGGASTTVTAVHPGNQSGWTKYYSSSQVDTSGGEVKLSR